MQIPIHEAVLSYLCPCIADVLTGFGLAVLLEFSRLSPDSKYLLMICMAVLLVLGIVSFFTSINALNRLAYAKTTPAWLSMCNVTYSLILSLSLSLNLLSQLCPPSGKELSLIPIYSLLCIPRTHPSSKALAVLAVGGVLLACAFLVLPTSRAARPSGVHGLADASSAWMLAVSLFASGWLQTFTGQHQNTALHDPWQAGMWRALAVVCKGLLLVLLGAAKNTSLYHFMYERANTVPKELFLAYGILLLFACMQAASLWFELLRQVLGSQAKWRLVVRIQHIIYALIVAAAWAYPLQLHGLRVMILTALLALNAISAVL